MNANKFSIRVNLGIKIFLGTSNIFESCHEVPSAITSIFLTGLFNDN